MLLNCGVGEDCESPLDWKEIQPVHLKGNQSWTFTGRTDAEAETSIHWPPDAKNWFTGKDPDAGKDWRQEKKGMTEGEMVEWHEFEQAPGVGEGWGSLACYSPWGQKESDTTEQLNRDWYWRDCNPSNLPWANGPHRLPHVYRDPGCLSKVWWQHSFSGDRL